MYSVESFGRILKNLLFKILNALTVGKMTNNVISVKDRAGEIVPYAFKPFVCEEIRPKRNKVPYPRSGHRIGADSSNFYSFGGYNPLLEGNDHSDNDMFWVQSYPLFQELWRFNFAKREWVRFANSHTLPNELASNALLLYRNFLMVYGGTGSPFGFRCSNQLFVCKVNDEECLMDEVRTSGHLPMPAYGQALIFHSDYLYTIGGTTGVNYTCDIHRLNLKTLVWEVVYECVGRGAYEPLGRYRHEVGYDSNKIYILGGGTAQTAFDFQRVPVFNLEKNEWFAQETLRHGTLGIPMPRRCHGAVQVNTDHGAQVFVIGGHDGQNVFDDLWRLDLGTFQWTSFDTCRLPSPMYFHATAASPEGRVYIFGGICSKINEDMRRSNSIHSAWLCIPKLSEMCWEAVLHYNPQIVDCNSDVLIDAGLPRHFVKRLGNTDHTPKT